MTPEDIRQGEIAIAKWLGWTVKVFNQWINVYAPNGKYSDSCGVDTGPPLPRYASDWNAYGELLLALAHRGIFDKLRMIDNGEKDIFMATVHDSTDIHYGYSETPQEALFLATVQLPDVQKLIQKGAAHGVDSNV